MNEELRGLLYSYASAEIEKHDWGYHDVPQQFVIDIKEAEKAIEEYFQSIKTDAFTDGYAQSIMDANDSSKDSGYYE